MSSPLEPAPPANTTSNTVAAADSSSPPVLPPSEEEQTTTEPVPWGKLSALALAILAAFVIPVVVILLIWSNDEKSSSMNGVAGNTLLLTEELQNLFSSVSSSDAFLEKDSPQSMAIDWLVNDDNRLAATSYFSSIEKEEDLAVQQLNRRILDERYALVVFYFSTGGGTDKDGIPLGWGNIFNFLDSSSSVCEWNGIDPDTDAIHGVLCDSIGSSDTDEENVDKEENKEHRRGVSTIRLPSNFLEGSLPAELSLLSGLRGIFLNGNQLSGTIPSEIGLLTSLEFLELDNNAFNGEFPLEISFLLSLQSARFEFNQDLMGTLSWCRDPRGSPFVLVANCDDDNVQCPCCTQCCSADTAICRPVLDLNLTSLLIDEFGLVVIDAPPGTPYHLATQWLFSSPVDDAVLMEVSSLRLIQRYILALFYYQTSENGMSPWRSCNPSPHLPSLNETEFDDLCTFLQFNRQENDDITYVPIQGQVRWLSSQHECDWVGVSCSSSFDGRMISKIELFGQKLTGTLPTELATLPFLDQVSLPYNELTGTIPSDFATVLDLFLFEVHGNMLSGTIPEAFYKKETPRRLAVLNVGDNLLTGTLDTRIGLLSNLRGLHIFDNNFEGTFPTEISNLESLAFIRFNNNTFSGTLPTEFGRLFQLSEFWAHQNNFTGPIPTELQNLRLLQELRLWGNLMTGTIPSEIFSLRRLSRLSVRDMKLTGTLSTLVGQLTRLVILRVSTNQLTGTIPSEIGNLPLLRVAWLHRNQFEGELPPNICRNVGVDRLEFLQTDCFPIDDPPNPCICCSACCNRETNTCELKED